MPKTPPGKTREQIFNYVQKRLFDGSPPTIREVQQAFRFRAVETARSHLEILVNEGRLQKRKGEARGYALPNFKNKKILKTTKLVPILGRVQAGHLSPAIEDMDGHILVESTNTTQNLLALRVQGESMTGAGIYSGDLVLVQQQATANNQDIVVALIEDEATVKRLRIRKQRYELHPENPDFKVIIPPPECKILGKVIEVRRFLNHKTSAPQKS